MALITDTLRTVLEIQGLNAYLSNLRQVQQGSLAAALQTAQFQQNLTGLPRLLNQVTQSLGIAIPQWALMATGAFAVVGAVRQVASAMEQAMQTFDRYNDALTRATVLFGNAGRGNQAGNLAGMAQGRLFGLGISEDRSLNLAGRMAELGYSPGTIKTLLPGLQEINAGSAGRISEDRALTMITRALLSESSQGLSGKGSSGGRGMQALGSRLGLSTQGLIPGDLSHNIQYLADQIHEKFGGVAEALANTASGVHERTQTLLATAMGRLGGLIEYGLLPVFEATNFLLKGFIAASTFILEPSQGKPNVLLESLIAGFASAFGGPLAGGGVFESRRRAREAGDAAARHKAQHDSDALDAIAANTQRIASVVAVSVFGNASSFSRQALSWNSLNHAMTIRV